MGQRICTMPSILDLRTSHKFSVVSGAPGRYGRVDQAGEWTGPSGPAEAGPALQHRGPDLDRCRAGVGWPDCCQVSMDRSPSLSRFPAYSPTTTRSNCSAILACLRVKGISKFENQNNIFIKRKVYCGKHICTFTFIFIIHFNLLILNGTPD